MSRKKSNGTRQDPPKTPKVWEKARREKMKIYFNELQEVLPLYDPSAPMSRFEILQKSRSYIKELQSQNQDLLNGGFDEVYKSKMEKLKQRVKELLQRVDQLTDLLRRANIVIPPLVPCPEKQESLTLTQKWMNQRPKKWTEKINVVVPDENIENILSLIKDFKKKTNSGRKTCKSYEKPSENKGPNVAAIKKPSFTERVELKKKRQLKKIKTLKASEANCYKSEKGNSDSFTDSQSPSHTKENQPVDFNLPINEESPGVSSENDVSNKNSQGTCANSDVCEKDVSEKAKTVVSSDKISIVSAKVKNLVESQNNVFLPANTNVVQSNTFLLTNDGNLVQFPLLNSSGNVFGANANLLAQAAIVNQSNTGLLTPLVINRPSPVIVLQKPAPQIQIVNPTPQILSMANQNIQIVGNSLVCATSSQNNKALPYILSKQPANKKRIAKDSTVTTFVNKIPIPALSKQSYVKKSIGLSNCVGVKGKNAGAKSKDAKDKSSEAEKTSSNDVESEVQSYEKEIQTEKFAEESVGKRKEVECEEGKESENESPVSEVSHQKRIVSEEETGNLKKQKISDENSVENVFKPIENPILADPRVTSDGLFCNLKLPTSIGNNLSVSPTAAFLSTFPIVASSKFEDELSCKIDERREADKDPKMAGEKCKEKEIPTGDIPENKTCDVPEVGKGSLQPTTAGTNKDEENEKRIISKENCDMSIVGNSMNAATSDNTNNNNISDDGNKNGINNAVINGNINQCSQLNAVSKSWEEYHQQPKNCEVRSDPFYIHADLQNPVPPPVLPDIPNSVTFPDPNSIYKNYPQNNMKTNFNVQIPDQMSVKNNQFEYGQKENFPAKRMNYNGDRNGVKKQCSNVNVNDTYSMLKNQTPMYQTEQPNYQLVPVKEMAHQRNSRPPVNWMTDPDVRTRTMSYGSTGAAATATAAAAPPPSKIPPFTQPDIFYTNNQKSQPDATDYILTDINKPNYQKNDFYVNKNVDVQMKVPDQRCKNVEKRSDGKFPAKPPTQNSYNIFDYNYNGNYFGEEESNKFCNVQSFQSNGVKTKKVNSGMGKKKTENPVHIPNGIQQSNDSSKRNPDQIISNLDFNPVGNQECFSWVPGKNVEWLPSKSFVDTNLILPSTLPTLVGDLALGTTTSNEVAQTKGNRPGQSKTGLEPATGKSYVDLGLVNSDNGNKQYLEPFTNLSKNIFDLAPASNVQNPQLSKTDCEKSGYVGNANETIVLKNIFELPVSKSFGNDFTIRNNKQRTVNNTQNNFLSVSQLVETPNYENNSIKSETSMEKQQDSYGQSYGNYHGKQYKNKNRNSHYKYNDRKYHGYKNASSNYTAEALIRSNANLSYQGNDYQSEVNSNFYAGKNPQKPENFPNGNEPIPKTDFIPCTTQNIYSEFNFSSPVPNFNISTSVNAEYVAHDGSFSAQNNAFFGDFIPPEYPITETVSNSLLLPPCTIGLQNPFIIEKRNATPEKGKQAKNYSNSRSRKNFDCSKSYSDFSTSSGIFTSAGIACPTIFTTTTCQNLLPVPNQNIPDPNITFSASSFTASNITFPPLTTNSNPNYHRPPVQNSSTTAFFPSTCPSMFTTCSTTTVSSSRTCLSTIPPTSSSSAVITTPFSVGNTPFPSTTQSTLPFLSLSNPIIPPSVPSTSGNTLANFNLSTIFPEINQKGNYHYP